jgi:hypothetical protein
MNEREQAITRALLNALDQLDGGLSTEPMLQGAMQREIVNAGEVRPTLMEFEKALHACDTSGWIVGTPSHVTKVMKWGITDEGRVALRELK